MKTTKYLLLAPIAFTLAVPAFAQNTDKQHVSDRLGLRLDETSKLSASQLRHHGPTPSHLAGFRLVQAEGGEGNGGRRSDGARNAKDIGQSQRGTLEEIIVTAQKRSERLQDVPISIAVLGGDQLDKSTVRGIAEALNRVPGVSTQLSTTDGRNGRTGGMVVVRGLPAAQGASPTAYYLDSIPFGFARLNHAPDPNAYDLQRVEVLRGPQGTLYGLSALNGVVRVLTQDADLESFELKGRLSASSTDHGSESFRGDAALNVPIVEGKLAARAVVGYQELGGWIDKSIKRDANRTDIGTYRLKLNAKPTDKLSMGLFAWISRSDTDAPPISADGRTNLSPLKEPSSVDYDAYGLKLGYDFSGFSLSAMTSYIDYANQVSFDFAPFTTTSIYSNAEFDSQVFSQEMVLNSVNDEFWRWTLGGIYRDAEDRILLSRTDPVTGALTAPLYLAPSISGITSESFAMFGELTRLFLGGRVEITGGLRYFEDEVRDFEISRQSVVGGIPAAGLASLSNTFDHVSPRLVAAWHPKSESTLYASYSEGFRSGQNQSFVVQQQVPGFPPVDPDKLKNYEIGLKGSVWGGRLSFDTAIYYMDWQGVPQALQIRLSPTFLVAALYDAGSASGMGMDLGLTAEVIEGLSLGLSGSWNELEVDQDVLFDTPTAADLVYFPKGSRLNQSPEYTVRGSIDYVFPLGSGGLRGQFSAVANYVPQVTIARSTPSAIVPSRTWYQESYVMARASFGVQASNWMASLYVDNLANEEGIAFDQFSPRWNTYFRPRTVGVQLEYKY